MPGDGEGGTAGHLDINNSNVCQVDFILSITSYICKRVCDISETCQRE